MDLRSSGMEAHATSEKTERPNETPIIESGCAGMVIAAREIRAGRNPP
jgi:hypothetical protein